MNLVRNPQTGEVILGQAPNAPMLAFTVSSVIAWLFPDDRIAETARGVAVASITVWALDELLRGSTPLRRLMGLATLGVLAGRALR